MFVQYLIALYFFVEIATSTSAEMMNYEKRDDGFEGDLFSHRFYPTSRAVASSKNLQWPNHVVPYDLSGIKSQKDRTLIANAMKTLMNAVNKPSPGQKMSKKCIEFRPRLPNDETYLKVISGKKCHSSIGYYAKKTRTMELGERRCYSPGTVQHELMHVLGFHHEHMRPDRDSYITVYETNIIPSEKPNFDKLKWGVDVLDQKLPYDYGSIMHYKSDGSSRNNKPTIVPKKPGVKIGQREKLSDIDIAGIRAYYHC